jgi:protein SCO1
MASSKDDRYRRAFHAVSMMLAGALLLCACKPANDPGAYGPGVVNDCLPALTFTDQHGDPISLASLKGKPVLIDFIYTACPGACLTLTQKMARIVASLEPQLRAGVTLVSITIDPEHDGPAALASYARKQGAEYPNWLFLTAGPGNLDQELSLFAVRRVRKPDGSIDHITGIFLLGPDGREIHEYEGQTVRAGTVVADLKSVVNREPG